MAQRSDGGRGNGLVQSLESPDVLQRRPSVQRRRSQVLDEIFGANEELSSPELSSTTGAIQRPGSSQALSRLNSAKFSSLSRAQTLERIPSIRARPGSQSKSSAKPTTRRSRKVSIVLEEDVDETPESKALEAQIQRPFFPEWLSKNSDFQSLVQTHINTVDARRRVAENYLKFAFGEDPQYSERYYQGPRRANRVRRNAIMHVARKAPESSDQEQRETEHSGDFGGGQGAAKKTHQQPQVANSQQEREDEMNPLTAKRQFGSNLQDVDFSQAERYIQRAFVLRARAFGIDHPATREARHNLLKCYLAQSKAEEARDVRDSIETHLIVLERSLADFEGNERREHLNRRLKYAAKGAAITTYLQRNATTDALSLRRPPRTVKLAEPSNKEEAMLGPSKRFQGQTGDDSMASWNILRGTAESMESSTIRGARPTGVAVKKQAAPTSEEGLAGSASAPLLSPISGSMSTARSSATKGSISKASAAEPQKTERREETYSVTRGRELGMPPARPLSPLKVPRRPPTASGMTVPDEGAMVAEVLPGLAGEGNGLAGGGPPPPWEWRKELENRAKGERSHTKQASKLMAAPLSVLKEETRDALKVGNYGTAADMARAGLERDAGDSALRAMFRASLGKLSEYPRSDDFSAKVSLATPTTAILGEPMDVKYEFQHLIDKDREHTPLDWIGVFLVRSEEVREAISRRNSAIHSAPSLSWTTAEPSEERLVETNIDFGDGPQEAPEVLVGWTLVPQPNKGQVRFEGIPAQPGTYRLRYFVRGSQCRLGPVLNVRASYVRCAMTVPERFIVGQPLVVKYTLAYRQQSRSDKDWAGLFPLVPKRSKWRKLASVINLAGGGTGQFASGMKNGQKPPGKTPYDPERPVVSKRLPPTNNGQFEFRWHPVYPGRYVVRFFAGQFNDTMFGESRPIVAVEARLPMLRFLPFRREIRVYVSSSFSGTHFEREALVRLALPRLRAACEKLSTSITFVDLRHKADMAFDIDLPHIADLAMKEAESCLPFGVCLLGQSYGWVPPTLRPWMALRFPWFRHFTNSELEDVHAKESNRDIPFRPRHSLVGYDEPPKDGWRIRQRPTAGREAASSRPGSRRQRPPSRGAAGTEAGDAQGSARGPSALPHSLTSKPASSLFGPRKKGAEDALADLSAVGGGLYDPSLRPAHTGKAKTSLLELITGKRSASSLPADQVVPSQDLGPSVSRASILEMEMTALFSIPGLRTPLWLLQGEAQKASRVKSLVAAAKKQAVAAASEEKSPLELLQELLDQEREADTKSSVVVYTRHPSLVTSALVPELATKFSPIPRAAEMALLLLRNASVRRGDIQKNGYTSATELVDWVANDVERSVHRFLPSSRAPSATEIASWGAAGFGAMRMQTLVHHSGLYTAMDTLTQYALVDDSSKRPLAVVGAAGSGKSTLLAAWLLCFVRDYGVVFDPVHAAAENPYLECPFYKPYSFEPFSPMGSPPPTMYPGRSPAPAMPVPIPSPAKDAEAYIRGSRRVSTSWRGGFHWGFRGRSDDDHLAPGAFGIPPTAGAGKAAAEALHYATAISTTQTLLPVMIGPDQAENVNTQDAAMATPQCLLYEGRRQLEGTELGKLGSSNGMNVWEIQRKALGAAERMVRTAMALDSEPRETGRSRAASNAESRRRSTTGGSDDLEGGEVSSKASAAASSSPPALAVAEGEGSGGGPSRGGAVPFRLGAAPGGASSSHTRTGGQEDMASLTPDLATVGIPPLPLADTPARQLPPQQQSQTSLGIAVTENLPPPPQRFLFTGPSGSAPSVGLYVVCGEGGGPSSGLELLQYLVEELVLLTGGKCALAAESLRQALQEVREGSESKVLDAVAAFFAAVAHISRVLVVIDGIDGLFDASLGSSPGLLAGQAMNHIATAQLPQHMRASTAAAQEEQKSQVHPPPPLWWLPSRIPPGFNIVASMDAQSTVWSTWQSRAWGSTRVEVNPLNAHSQAALLQHVLSPWGATDEWSRQVGTSIRYHLHQNCPEVASAVTTTATAAAKHGEGPVTTPSAKPGAAVNASGGGKGGAKEDQEEESTPDYFEGDIVSSGQLFVSSEEQQRINAAVQAGDDGPIAKASRSAAGVLTFGGSLSNELWEMERLYRNGHGSSSSAPQGLFPRGSLGAAMLRLWTEEPPKRDKPFLLRNPRFLRTTLARLCLAETASDALALSVRARHLFSPSLAIEDILWACEKYYPLAIDVLCLLCCSVAGLAESELLDLLGGDWSVYSAHIIQSQVMSSSPRPGDSQPSGRGGANSNPESGRQSGRRKGGSAASAGTTLPGSNGRIAPFDMVDWCEARRVLLGFGVVRTRGLWCLEGGALRKTVATTLLPTYLCEIPWLQRLAYYWWRRPVTLRRCEELPGIVHRLFLHAGKFCNTELLEEWRQEEAAAAGGGGGGGSAGPASSSSGQPHSYRSHQVASVAQLRSVLLSQPPLPRQLLQPEGTFASTAVEDGSLLSYRLVGGVNKDKSAKGKNESQDDDKDSKWLKKPPSALLRQAQTYFPLDPRALVTRLLGATMNLEMVMMADMAGGLVKARWLQAIRAIGLTMHQVVQLLRAGFEAFHGIYGFVKSPSYQHLSGGVVDLDAHRVVLNVQTQGLHVTPTNTNIPYAYLQPSLVFGLSEYTRDAKKHNGNRAPSQDPQRKAEVRRRAFISEELWERLRILGPTQLCRLANVMLEFGHAAAAQTTLETAIMMNSGFRSIEQLAKAVPQFHELVETELNLASGTRQNRLSLRHKPNKQQVHGLAWATAPEELKSILHAKERKKDDSKAGQGLEKPKREGLAYGSSPTGGRIGRSIIADVEAMYHGVGNLLRLYVRRLQAYAKVEKGKPSNGRAAGEEPATPSRGRRKPKQVLPKGIALHELVNPGMIAHDHPALPFVDDVSTFLGALNIPSMKKNKRFPPFALSR